ncbi:hypothetical protein MMC10_011184 [Thelotrema lepadinum]|nr:hypothetical protein [Thelotrema lepadinum]
MTVLHYLSWSKMTTADEIRLLSKNDPLPLTLKDNLGRSALHFAVMRGNTPLILYLLELGIYPCQSLVTLQGATLLHLAVTSRRVETLDLVAPYSESIFVKDDKGRSILHYAVWHFNGMAVEKIITQGGWDLVRQSDCDGETPKELARRIKARSILTYIEELDGIATKPHSPSQEPLTPSNLAQEKMSSPQSLSTEPPSLLTPSLPPVPLKYVPLPTPLQAIPPNHPQRTATSSFRPPCRRCLLDASPGETLYLLSYDPFPTDSTSPYRGLGPIFVHTHACKPFEGEMLPERQLRRLLAVRAYDEEDMLVGSEVVKGEELERVAGGMLADGKARWVGLWNAGPGCFAVRVERRG